VPTLAIIGANDPLKKGVDDLRGHMGGLERIVVIEGADHMSAFVHADFVKCLLEFLQKHTAK
jgi:pimeloyl-ACP methyl ester carboxylesterase